MRKIIPWIIVLLVVIIAILGYIAFRPEPAAPLVPPAAEVPAEEEPAPAPQPAAPKPAAPAPKPDAGMKVYDSGLYRFTYPETYTLTPNTGNGVSLARMVNAKACDMNGECHSPIANPGITISIEDQSFAALSAEYNNPSYDAEAVTIGGIQGFSYRRGIEGMGEIIHVVPFDGRVLTVRQSYAIYVQEGPYAAGDLRFISFDAQRHETSTIIASLILK